MPPLPLELERQIFELAAFQDTDHNSRVRIILVAKRVYEWIRPILYHVAIVKESLRQRSPILSIQNWRNAQITELADTARFVRHLLILVDDGPRILETMATFPNVENLAIWSFLSSDISETLHKMNNLPLRMLSVDLKPIKLDEAIKNCQVFKNLTHLEILSLNGSTWNDCKALMELPRLTHLCFETSIYLEDGVILGLLEHCASLRALIFLTEAGLVVNTTKSDDPRYLFLRDRMTLRYTMAEWERSANGQIGCWELADIIIQARKGKLFKDNSSCIFSRKTWMDDLNDDGKRWYQERLRI